MFVSLLFISTLFCSLNIQFCFRYFVHYWLFIVVLTSDFFSLVWILVMWTRQLVNRRPVNEQPCCKCSADDPARSQWHSRMWVTRKWLWDSPRLATWWTTALKGTCYKNTLYNWRSTQTVYSHWQIHWMAKVKKFWFSYHNDTFKHKTPTLIHPTLFPVYSTGNNRVSLPNVS